MCAAVSTRVTRASSGGCARSLASRSSGGEDSARDGLERLEAEGLLQVGDLSLLEKALVLGVPTRARDDDHAAKHLGLPPFQLAVESHAVELGHTEVREDQIVRAGLALFERGEAVAGQVDHIALVGQDAREHASDRSVVLDYEYAKGPAVLRHAPMQSKPRARPRGQRNQQLMGVYVKAPIPKLSPAAKTREGVC